MEAVLPALERACSSEQWVLAPIDVDHAENAQLIRRFDADGHEVLHLVGYQSPEQLRRTLEREVQVACAGADELPPADNGAGERDARVTSERRADGSGASATATLPSPFCFTCS